MKDFISELSTNFFTIIEEIDTVKENLEKVKAEAKKAERTGQDIQRKFDEFQAVAQPKLDKINELVENINKNQKTENPS